MIFYNPNNFKQGQLLLSRYYPKELVTLITSTLVTVALVMLITMRMIGVYPLWVVLILLVLSLLPAGLAFFLLHPYEGYHNAYHFFKLKIQFKNKNYMWEGIYYDSEGELDGD